MNTPVIALLYDFDKTLCTTDMEDYTFIPALGYTPGEFWGRANDFGRENRMDGLLAYMYTMMQVCRQLDMTYQTLKYYCNEGLIPNVKRDSNNRRIFDEKDVKWIKDLTCLKKCGMSIQEMKEYLQLCLQGTSTIMPRKEIQKKVTALLC